MDEKRKLTYILRRVHCLRISPFRQTIISLSRSLLTNLLNNRTIVSFGLATKIAIKTDILDVSR